MPAKSQSGSNSPVRILFATMTGTAIEFFDFTIYATAAVLVFPSLFFPPSNPSAARLGAAATFGIAFLARPFGSALFGHFGDRIGRKRTLVVALSTMGVSTVAIGILPVYRTVGLLAPLLLALCRLGQGIGLGGEWGGAILLATESAPPGKRAWYGMFPQLGAPVGIFLASGVFLLLSRWLTNGQFLAYGWRLPFLASAVLIFLGLYMRLNLTETPVFRAALEQREQVKVPLYSLFRYHWRPLITGTLVSLAPFVLFYLITVFTLSWGTSALGYSRSRFLLMQLFDLIFFAVTIPISGLLAERGRKRYMIGTAATIGVFGFVLAPLLTAGTIGVITLMAIGMALLGLSTGPLGTVLSELFPTSVRYTGSSIAFNLAGILGASLAPYIAIWLAKSYGLAFVGYYLTASAALTLLGLLSMRETKDDDLSMSGSKP